MGTGQTMDREPSTRAGDRKKVQSKEGRSEEGGCAQSNSESGKIARQSRGRPQAK